MSCEIWKRKYKVFFEVFFVSELNSEMWKTGETWVKIFPINLGFFLSLFSKKPTTSCWNCQHLWAEEFHIVWQILTTPLNITLAMPVSLCCHFSPRVLSIALAQNNSQSNKNLMFTSCSIIHIHVSQTLPYSLKGWQTCWKALILFSEKPSYHEVSVLRF